MGRSCTLNYPKTSTYIGCTKRLDMAWIGINITRNRAFIKVSVGSVIDDVDGSRHFHLALWGIDFVEL